MSTERSASPPRADNECRLIVNADDLGASEGINRGIEEAHVAGIVTSASLMVEMPASGSAACLARRRRDLDVGLHVQLTRESGEPLVPFADPHAVRCALERQIEAFEELMGQWPTHVDSHHNIHRDPALTPLFIAFARDRDLPLREHSDVRYVSSFYGQWDGVTHLEQISVATLLALVDSEAGPGFTEVGCHPGYPEPAFTSGYGVEREHEIRTLCDPAVREALASRGIRLASFRDRASVRGGV